MCDLYMIVFLILIMQIKYVFGGFTLENISMKKHRRFTRTMQIATIIEKEIKCKSSWDSMSWGTNKDFTSHMTRNHNKVQNKRHDWRHIENSLNGFFKMDDGISWFEVDVTIESGTRKTRRSGTNSSLIGLLWSLLETLASDEVLAKSPLKNPYYQVL